MSKSGWDTAAASLQLSPEAEAAAKLRKTAYSLYKAPFKFQHGYIFDAVGNMVSDDGTLEDSVARVRGWGRIGYMENAPALQDEIGKIIAEALTQYWKDWANL